MPGSGDASSLPLVVTPPVGRTCDASSFRPFLGVIQPFWVGTPIASADLLLAVSRDSSAESLVEGQNQIHHRVMKV